MISFSDRISFGLKFVFFVFVPVVPQRRNNDCIHSRDLNTTLLGLLPDVVSYRGRVCIDTLSGSWYICSPLHVDAAS